MTDALLVRHGETDWNAEGRLQGHTDRPLNDFGRRRRARSPTPLAGDDIAAVYASDLSRARETAEIVGERLGLAGRHRPGSPREELGQLGRPDRAERDRSRATRASRREEHRRAHAARRAADRGGASRRAASLVVTHGGSLRRIQVAALGMALPVIENCAVWAVAHEDGAFRRDRLSRSVEDYTSKYKGEQVEVALFGGEYQEGVLTAYCYVDEVAHIELNGHILVPLQNIASLHCSSRCDAPQNEDWPPRGLLDDEAPGDEPDDAE